MAEKLYEYQGLTGLLHGIRDSCREKVNLWKEQNPDGVKRWLQDTFLDISGKNGPNGESFEDYSHIFRKKTRRELVRVSAAVMGIEFSYAAETAFVSPTLLKIGVQHQHMTLVWALSPLIGFFLTPVLGSLSDRCHWRIGRRRPFILFMSLGVFLGLILVPNGENMGYFMGDQRPPKLNTTVFASHRTSANFDNSLNLESNIGTKNHMSTENILTQNISKNNPMPIAFENWRIPYNNSHPWGVFFTVLGTVLLDFDADACQSPARAYLLDVSVPEDHARGLSTFTVMAGLGGFMGYALGGVNWDVTFLGALLGGHVKAVFTLITLIFVTCVSYTITSFREMPLSLLEERGNLDTEGLNYENFIESENLPMEVGHSYGAVENQLKEEIASKGQHLKPEHPHLERQKSIAPDPNASLLIYLQSIIYMPYSIRMLCLTNLFCWMAHVCYSLYFTDFVGEAVFEGNPTAPEGTVVRELYESGIRFGCWGMSMYSLSCACYSMIIERLIAKFGAKRVYIGGLLIYSTGMLLMAFTKNKFGVILFSWTAGVMYSTLFTMPYLIVAHYHAKSTFEISQEGTEKISTQIRGLGTDIAIVSSMVFLAQFILSICMGTIVSWSGTTTAVVSVASFLAFLGAISASQVVYLDL